jgi:hypothetical protein
VFANEKGQIENVPQDRKAGASRSFNALKVPRPPPSSHFSRGVYSSSQV